MKNLFKLFVPVAAAAIALVSCQPKEEQIGNNPAGEVTIRVHATADNLKAGDQETKTYIDNYQGTANTILWGTGEYMKLALTAGETTTFATSTDASADLFDGEPEAMFEFSVTPGEANEYVYQGLYPASAAATSNNTNAANYKVNLPAIQNATASSYDPAAYIMVAKPETFTSVQTDWEASYRRGTALNKITLKNVPDGVSFNKVKITAEGKKLAGGRHFNLTAGEGLEVYGTDATIEVLYATPLTGTSMDVWFTSWDTEIAEGEKLTIIAYTTDNKSYTKEITARSGGIKFQEGYLNTLGASLSGITAQVVSSLDGDYVILAKKDDSTFYALKGEASGTRIASVNYDGSLTSYNGDASIVWTIATSGTGYTIKNGSNYVGWTSGSGNAADLIAEADYDADKCLMGIDDNGDGTYKIYVAADTGRILARNQSNAYFAFYSNTQYKDLVLVPATSMEQVKTPTFSEAEGAVASGTTVTISTETSGATIYYTTDGSDPTTASTQGTSVTITATTTIKAIAVKSGMADSEIATATYTIAGAGSDWELVSDFSTIADGGEYIFVNVQNSTSYYMNTATCNQGGGTGCVALTILPTESGFVASDNMILVLSGSADGFVASNKEGKQLKIGATNNGLAINADSGTSLAFYTDENLSGYTLKGNDTNNVVRYIGMNSTTNFRCYNSVNNNVKTGEYVWYHHIGTGSNVTWNLESISIATPPTTTTYTAGQSFDPAGMVVTGHFVDADNASNTKDEAVTGYTITPSGALSETDDHVTITYQGKSTTQAITVNAAPVNPNTSTEENPYSTADAIDLAQTLGSGESIENVYVSGIISRITTAFNSQYNNVTFMISADGSTTEEFEIYRMPATSANDFLVGDAVEIKGTLVNYNGNTPEISAGADLINQLHKPTFTPDGGNFTTSQSVSISAASGATIKYSLDGTAPSLTYSSALSLTETTTVQAIAISGILTTGIATATFTKNSGGGNTPTSVTYDFTGDDWEVSSGVLTNGTDSFTGEGAANFKMNAGYFILGKTNAYINFPAYQYPVYKIVVTGRSGASGSVVQNIFVGSTAVSTATTGATGTNTYNIASGYQAAGTIYTLKVTSNHNTQITKIEVFFN